MQVSCKYVMPAGLSAPSVRDEPGAQPQARLRAKVMGSLVINSSM